MILDGTGTSDGETFDTRSYVRRKLKAIRNHQVSPAHLTAQDLHRLQGGGTVFDPNAYGFGQRTGNLRVRGVA